MSFINYAHRGASEYCPENTFLSFYTGLFMGADGIETDVRRTLDGKLVLFHDKTLERVCKVAGSIEDHSYADLCKLDVKNGGLCDKIPLFEDFLAHFSSFDIKFAIELKGAVIEEEVVGLIKKYGIESRTTITSFEFEYICNVKKISDLRCGYLAQEINDQVLADCRAHGIEEICPKVSKITAEEVAKWHNAGFGVRAWGVKTLEDMRLAFDSGADGTTCNFPDKLKEYIDSK